MWQAILAKYALKLSVKAGKFALRKYEEHKEDKAIEESLVYNPSMQDLAIDMALASHEKAVKPVNFYFLDFKIVEFIFDKENTIFTIVKDGGFDVMLRYKDLLKIKNRIYHYRTEDLCMFFNYESKISHHTQVDVIHEAIESIEKQVQERINNGK